MNTANVSKKKNLFGSKHDFFKENLTIDFSILMFIKGKVPFQTFFSSHSEIFFCNPVAMNKATVLTTLSWLQTV